MNAMMRPIASNVRDILLSLIWFQANMYVAPAVVLQTINFLIMKTRAGIPANPVSAIDPGLVCLNLWLSTIKDYPHL